eukprot:2456927-Prymnesium_polylepis.2
MCGLSTALRFAFSASSSAAASIALAAASCFARRAARTCSDGRSATSTPSSSAAPSPPALAFAAASCFITILIAAACEQPRFARTIATRWCSGITTVSPSSLFLPPAVSTAGRKRTDTLMLNVSEAGSSDTRPSRRSGPFALSGTSFQMLHRSHSVSKCAFQPSALGHGPSGTYRSHSSLRRPHSHSQ